MNLTTRPSARRTVASTIAWNRWTRSDGFILIPAL